MAANFMRVQAQLMASSADTWAMAAQRFAEQSSTAGSAAAAEASPLRQDGEWVDEGEACTPTAAAGSVA